MAKSQQKPKTDLKKYGATPDTETVPVTPEALTSRQEIADELRMSVYTFAGLVKKYPFGGIGVPGKINGRWRITKDNAWRWFRYVQRQELRHPDARRMRPEEAPGLSEIRGR